MNSPSCQIDGPLKENLVRPIFKVLILSSVVLVTWQITKSLTAKPMLTSAPFTHSLDSRAPTLPAGVKKIPLPILAKMSFDAFSVNILDGQAIISGAVSMSDLRPKVSFVWRLRILGPGRNVLASHIYSDQIFAMGTDGHRKPKFNEVIDLPKGKSRVELSLFELDTGSDLAFFQDESAVDGHLVLRNFRDVTLE